MKRLLLMFLCCCCSTPVARHIVVDVYVDDAGATWVKRCKVECVACQSIAQRYAVKDCVTQRAKPKEEE